MLHIVEMGMDFASAYREGLTGTVHSVFERAINISAGGELLTLLCDSGGMMTASAVAARLPSSVKPGDNVNFRDAMNIENAKLWHRIPDREIANLSPKTNIEVITLCEMIENQLQDSEELLTMPLADFDVSRLIGNGLGLTPAGDDYLAGMLHALHFMEHWQGKKNSYLPNLRQSIAENIHKTNEISRHFLSYALKAEWGRATEELLLAITENNSDILTLAVQAKASYGASSGADEMCGIIHAIREFVADCDTITETRINPV